MCACHPAGAGHRHQRRATRSSCWSAAQSRRGEPAGPRPGHMGLASQETGVSAQGNRPLSDDVYDSVEVSLATTKAGPKAVRRGHWFDQVPIPPWDFPKTIPSRIRSRRAAGRLQIEFSWIRSGRAGQFSQRFADNAGRASTPRRLEVVRVVCMKSSELNLCFIDRFTRFNPFLYPFWLTATAAPLQSRIVRMAVFNRDRLFDLDGSTIADQVFD